MHLFRERVHIVEQGFAAGDDHGPCRLLRRPCHNFIDIDHRVLGGIPGAHLVAEGTADLAAPYPDEPCGLPRVVAFALQRVELLNYREIQSFLIHLLDYV